MKVGTNYGNVFIRLRTIIILLLYARELDLTFNAGTEERMAIRWVVRGAMFLIIIV